ncbi:MAG: lamin tail domain-containing protein, partial [Nanoarchaeota archaeon]
MKLNHSITTLVILLILLIKPTSASLIINEIMYNPPDKFDDDLEWTEIYNNSTESINLSTWKLDGEDIGNSILAPKNYIVIAREIIDDDNDGMSFEALYGNNDSIWNSDDIINAVETSIMLNNDFDTVNLSDGNSTYSVVYNNSIGGNNNGKTLEFLNGRFLESKQLFGTPGKENSIEENNTPKINLSAGLKLSIILSSSIYKNTEYTSLFRIDNLGHIDGTNDNINLTISYEIIGMISNTTEILNLNSYISTNTGVLIINTTGNFILCGNITNSTIIDQNKEDDFACQNFTINESEKIICDIVSSIKTEKEIYSKETIEFYNLVNPESFPFRIEYWIEDIFGRVVKEKINTTNTNKKQFTPNIDEKVIVLII